jgi:CheY-like chemotaxis protein
VKRVLLVDDDPSLLRALWRLLRPEFEVLTATDGASALAALADFHPDLVISDASMPIMDGRELLAEVRRRDPSCRTLLLSGCTSGTTGDFPMFVKPWDSEQLLEWVRRWRPWPGLPTASSSA